MFLYAEPNDRESFRNSRILDDKRIVGWTIEVKRGSLSSSNFGIEENYPPYNYFHSQKSFTI